MLRRIQFLSVFAAGVAVGVIVMRALYGTSSAALPQVAESVSPHADAAPRVEAREASASATPLSAVPLSAVPLSVVKSPENSASAADAPPPAMPASAPAFDAAAVMQPIDVGPVLNKMVARASQPGFENQIGDAHRALERETRDEGWAYTMESELQSSMLNEATVSGFKTEHVVCRATLCEVRLSGTGQQQNAGIKRWNESFIGQASPLGQRLFLNYSSSISDNDRTETLLIFRKPPAPKTTQKSS